MLPVSIRIKTTGLTDKCVDLVVIKQCVRCKFDGKSRRYKWELPEM
jgi:hypothetical protein